MDIKQVSVEKILPLRQRILRPGKSLHESTFPNDKVESTIHLVVFQNEKIVAVASLMRENSEHNSAKNQYRLRGMAVSSEDQGQHLGKALFEEGLRLLKEKRVTYLWFNARIGAADFYKKQDCQVLGEGFMIPDVGPHVYMFKTL